MAEAASLILSHWHQLLEGYQESPQRVYSLLEEAIKKRQLPDSKVFRVVMHEKGLLSAKREYLRVQSKKHIFDICAAPYGISFFLSWWLCEQPIGCLGILLGIPIIGPILSFFIPASTYFTYDTALMFRDSIHNAVMDTVDQITSEKGLRALTEMERKPVLSDFFKR